MAYFCEPKWHNGRRQLADFTVRAIKRTSKAYSPTQRWADNDMMYMPMFCCCKTHLGRATEVMTELHGNVRVFRIAEPKDL